MARTSGLKPSRLQRVLSVLGGADSQILARARVDTAEMIPGLPKTYATRRYS